MEPGRSNRMRNNFFHRFFLFFVVSAFFSSCTISENDRTEIIKIIELRENAMNSGDIESYRALLSDSFSDIKDHMDQVKLRNQYLKGFVYIFTTTQVVGVSGFGKKADIDVEFYLTYKRPEDVAPYVWIDRAETISFAKDKIGWRITGVKEIKNTGIMIKPEVVQEIFHALDTRISALNNGDVDLLKTVLSENYPDREGVISNFAANSEVFSDINYELQDRKFLFISGNRDEARLEQVYSLSFKIKETEGFENFKNQKEIISLKKDPQKSIWVITDGLK
jgi:hypothetical protein